MLLVFKDLKSYLRFLAYNFVMPVEATPRGDPHRTCPASFFKERFPTSGNDRRPLEQSS
jgi:hypothetical protein